MRKKSLFHATTSTKIIAGAVLCITVIIFSLFPLSSYMLDRLTPDVIELSHVFEQQLDAEIRIDSVSTDLLSRIHIEGVHVTDSSGHDILAIDTIEIAQSALLFLPKYLFTREIPVTVKGLKVSVQAEHEQKLLSLFSANAYNSSSRNSLPALTGTVTIHDIAILWEGIQYSGAADISSLRGTFRDGNLTSFSSGITEVSFQGGESAARVTDAEVTGTLDGGSLRTLQSTVGTAEGRVQGIFRDGYTEDLMLSFDSETGMRISGRELSAGINIGEEEEAQAMAAGFTLEMEGTAEDGYSGTLKTGLTTAQYEDISFESEMITLSGKFSPLQFSCTLEKGFLMTRASGESIQAEDTSFSLLNQGNALSLYLFSDSVSASQQLFSSLSEWVDVNDLLIENPSAYARYHQESGLIEWEADGDLHVDIGSPLETSLSALVFADGVIERSGKIESIDLRAKNISSTVMDPLFEGFLTYDTVEGEPVLSAGIQQGTMLNLLYTRKLNESRQTVTLQSQSLALAPYTSLIDLYAPQLLTYISDTSRFTGEFRGSFDDALHDIDLNTSVALTEIMVGDVQMNGAATLLLEADENTFTIPSSTVTTEGMRISYSGEIDRSTLFPRGELEAIAVHTGEQYASVLFSQDSQRMFRYSMSSALLKDVQAEGTLIRIGDQLISTTGDILLYGQTDPYRASFYLDTLTLEGSIPHVQMRLTFDQEDATLSGMLDAGGYVIPQGLLRQSGNGSMRVDGHLEGSYTFTNGKFNLSSPSISLSDIAFSQIREGRAELAFTMDESELNIDHIAWSDEFDTLEGKALLRIPQGDLRSVDSFIRNALISLTMSGEKESIDLIILPAQEEMGIDTAFSLDIINTDITRFFPSDQYIAGSMSIRGVSDLDTYVESEGEVSLLFRESGEEAEAEISINRDGIYIENGTITRGNAQLKDILLSYLYDGTVRTHASYRSEIQLIHRDASTRATVDASLNLNPSKHFFEAVKRLQDLREGIPEVTVELSDTSLFNMLTLPDSIHTVSYLNDVLSVRPEEGGMIDLTYDLHSGDLEIEASEDFLFPMKGKGFLSRDFISLDLSHAELDFTYLNAFFPDPSIFFNTGRFQGSVLIEGDPLNPGYWGTMSGKELSMSLFWLPDSTLYIENPIVALDNRTFTLPSTAAYVDIEGKTPATGTFNITSDFANWNLDTYEMAAEILQGTMPIYIPITNIDMLVQGDVYGKFGMKGTLKAETIYGDIVSPTAEISFGIPDLPLWYIPRARTSAEIRFTSGKNVSFVYPNSESPIVSATVQDNQRMSISMTAPELTYSFSGDIGLRSGEIYYVQENFYITEGNVHFQTGEGGSFDEILPRVDLRARLRKFDAEGERLDIYLILQNALLTDIEPRFESIPARTDNEILQLLGQNLLSTGFSSQNDTGFQSVLNAATAATDVITRFGLIQGNTISFGFSSAIREALGLDVFTIRSNLLQNILLDAIPGATDNANASPFGRYLDNTTFYLGKYLADELYLQGLISMRRDATGNSSSFLASDLTLDTELSVEWLNPLASFSFFTQPNELSLFNIFDTMGFSVTKNIEF